MRKYRNDCILIGILLFFCVLGLALYLLLRDKDNLFVYIYYDKELVEVVDIQDEKEFVIHEVVIKIENEEVFVVFSSCKDQLCVHQGKISSAGQTITCLPQRVFVQIEGKGVDVFV